MDQKEVYLGQLVIPIRYAGRYRHKYEGGTTKETCGWYYSPSKAELWSHQKQHLLFTWLVQKVSRLFTLDYTRRHQAQTDSWRVTWGAGVCGKFWQLPFHCTFTQSVEARRLWRSRRYSVTLPDSFDTTFQLVETTPTSETNIPDEPQS